MINLIGPINQLGYGITSLNVLKSLNKITDVAFWCIGQPQVTTQEDADIVSSCLSKATMPDFNAACIRIWHQNDMSQFIGNGDHIGYPIFELDEFNKTEKHHLSSLDKIFVCSHWAKDIVCNNININKDNVIVVPLGVDTNIYKPISTNNSGPTVFFNCGKWEIRKGHDILYSLFNQAFSVSDNVELWMMNENPFLSKEESKAWVDLYLNSKLGSKIRIINRVDTQQEVYNIMKQTDCGIFPSRAEGWNLELLEMMACGLNVITTGYSAHTEFCQENPFNVPISSNEIAYDGKWFMGKCGKWAKIGQSEKDLFIEHMRNIHNLKQNQQLISNYHGIEIASKYNWDHSARIILNNV